MYLQKIVDYKRQELEHQRRKVSLKDVRLQAQDAEPARDFVGALLMRASEGRFPSGGSGSFRGDSDGGLGGRAVSPPAIIAEIKKASPSAGVIRPDFDPLRIAASYEENGAVGLSILTDEKFFQGRLTYLTDIRRFVKLPLLRKDFTLHEYHVHEARSAGADAILLIVSILEDSQLKDYADLAQELGMAALIEVHDEKDMRRAAQIGARLIGINNRNLDTFKVDLKTAEALSPKAPTGAVLVAESGISLPDHIKRLRDAGIEAFLIGESLLKADDPGEKLSELLKSSSGNHQ